MTKKRKELEKSVAELIKARDAKNGRKSWIKRKRTFKDKKAMSKYMRAVGAKGLVAMKKKRLTKV